MATFTLERIDYEEDATGTVASTAVVEVNTGPMGGVGPPGAQGAAGPNLIDNNTTLGTLSGITDPAFLLVGNAAGNAARKLTPTAWGLSNLLTSVPAGRVPYSDAAGLVTSNAGLTYGTTTGLRVQASGGIVVSNSGSTDLTISGDASNQSIVNRGLLYLVPGGGQVIFTGNANLAGYALTFGSSGLAQDSTGVVRVTNGSTGYGGLRAAEVYSHAVSGFVGNSNGIRFQLGQNGLGMTSACNISWAPGNSYGAIGDVYNVRDTEINRNAAGFVGLGSPSNKVVAGHDGTSGWVWTSAGKLVLDPFTGQLWFNSVGSSGMRTPREFGLSDNGSVNWTNVANNFYSAAIDTRLRRSSANTLDLDTGIDGTFAGMRLGKLSATTSAPGDVGLMVNGNGSPNTIAAFDYNGSRVMSVLAQGLFMGGSGRPVISSSVGYSSYTGLNINLASDNMVRWTNFGDTYTGFDTAFARNSAGVIEANNGTAGQYRDLKLRNVMLNDGFGGAVIQDHFGSTLFRTVNSTAWADNLSSYFMQVGPSGASGVLTSATGAQFARLMLSATGTHIWSGPYNTAPSPGSSTALTVGTDTATRTLLVLRGAASQSANLTEWRDSGGTVVAAVSAAGGLSTGNAPHGFYGVAPVARQTVAADATDLASAVTLINDLKAKLIALGAVQ